jgi:hypothetical protein
MDGSRLALVWLAWLTAAIPCLAAPRVVIDPVVQAPACITLVGSVAGVPARKFGEFRVVVTNTLLPQPEVVIDLSGCPDLELCNNQLDAAAVVDCTKKTVTKHTDVAGIATFTLLGGSVGNLPAGQGSGPLQGRIYVAGYANEAVSTSVCAYDLDGFSGVGANDFGMWLTDFGTGLPRARSDYDGDGIVGANDLSSWLTVFSDGSMAASCAGVCP